MSGEVPTLPREHLMAIYRQARAEFPNECCGFILGQGETSETVACQNVMDKYHRLDPEEFPRTAADGYKFDFKAARQLDESFGGDKPATIIYHSHPRVGAYFSDEDTAAAIATQWPVDYLVVDVQDDEIVEALLFRQKGDRYEQIARFDGAAV